MRKTPSIPKGARGGSSGSVANLVVLYGQESFPRQFTFANSRFRVDCSWCFPRRKRAGTNPSILSEPEGLTPLMGNVLRGRVTDELPEL